MRQLTAEDKQSAACTQDLKPAKLFMDSKIIIKHKKTFSGKAATSRTFPQGHLIVNELKKITLTFFLGHLYQKRADRDALSWCKKVFKQSSGQ